MSTNIIKILSNYDYLIKFNTEFARGEEKNKVLRNPNIGLVTFIPRKYTLLDLINKQYFHLFS